MTKTGELTEIEENPHAFGLPTFDEYSKRRDHYQEKFYGRADDVLSWADGGSKLLGRNVKRHIYEIEGYRCRTLEELQRVALSMGYTESDLDMRPELIPLGGGFCDIKVRFVSKASANRRGSW